MIRTMRKILLVLSILASICLSSCTSPFFDKTAQAYEEAAKKLAVATNDTECKTIHDELLSKLFHLTLEYPDWQKTVKGEKEDSKAIKKVKDSYDKWNEVLKETIKDGNYADIPLCTFQYAIEQSEGKNPEEQEVKLPQSVSEIDVFPQPNANSDIIGDMLDNYEDIANKYISDVKTAQGEETEYSEAYKAEFAVAQESKKKVKLVAYNCFSIAKAFNAEQKAKYLRINRSLSNFK